MQGLPPWLRAPLSEPLFLLGTLFILAVFFVPGGLAGLVGQLRGRVAARRSARPADAGPEPGAGRAVEQLREAAGRGIGVGAGGPRDGV